MNTVSGDGNQSKVVALVAFDVLLHGLRSFTCEELGNPQRSCFRGIGQRARRRVWGDVSRKLSDFRVVKNVLSCRGSEGGHGWQVAIPRNLQYDVLRACHENPTSGHERQEKTLKRLEARFW